MKIIYKQGDLLEAPERYILHGCNAMGRMASGVAKAIREKYPEVYKEYRELYYKSGLKVGDVQFVSCNDGKVVINGITQHFFGRDGKLYLDYNGLEEIIDFINRVIPIDSCIAMPKIGARLAGGDWNIISEIIERVSTRFQPVVYVKE